MGTEIADVQYIREPFDYSSEADYQLDLEAERGGMQMLGLAILCAGFTLLLGLLAEYAYYLVSNFLVHFILWVASSLLSSLSLVVVLFLREVNWGR